VSSFFGPPLPARWKGHLDHLLANPSKAQKVVHHTALPFSEIHGFVQRCASNPV